MPMPFWTALDDLCDQTRMTIYPYDQGPGLALRPKPDIAITAQRSRGLYRAAATRSDELTVERDPRIAANPQMRLGLEIAWEPRLRPISVELPLG